MLRGSPSTYAAILLAQMLSAVNAQGPAREFEISAGAMQHSTISPAVQVSMSDQSAPALNSGSQALLNELIATRDEVDRSPVAQRPVNPGWWQQLVAQPLRTESSSIGLTLDETLLRALENSFQIKVFSELPMIRQTAIVEADSAFDWNAFMETAWDDNSDPVGNSLTAGPGITRFRDHQLGMSAGLRRRTYSGGQVELSQQFGIQENNSQFFIPNNQGTSRLVLSYTHPLMRGRGQVYNRSLVCLAAIDKEVADEELLRQLQSHLLEVTRAYWAMYLERGVLLQKMNSFSRAKKTVERLEIRRNIDAAPSQIISAQAALKTRRAQLARAMAAVENAEARLRSLVNDPTLGAYNNVELLPADSPTFDAYPCDMQIAMQEALQYRPEVLQAIKQIKAASIRQNMSRNELMPVLNLVTAAYVAGLEDRRDIVGAWGNQFTVGEPGYSIGLQYEIPIHNRAARARYQRRRHELRQMQNQYATALETVNLEVQVAVREVETSQRELYAKEEAMRASVEQMEYIAERWERLPGEDVSASLTLENLLAAQERLADAEQDYLQSQLTYNLGLTNLKRATGTLLQHSQVTIAQANIDCLPTHVLDKH